MSKYGYRFWIVDKDGLLAPALSDSAVRWLPEPNKAKCNRSGFLKDHHRHQAPVKDCACGFYVHHNPIAPCACVTPTSEKHGAVGVARCWGRFEEHVLGTRWEYARPVALVDFTGRLDDRYRAAGVTVYPDLDTLYGEWAPDRDRWADERPHWCTALNWFGVSPGAVNLGAAAGNVQFSYTGGGFRQLNQAVGDLRKVTATLTVTGEQARRLGLLIQQLANGVSIATKNLAEKHTDQGGGGTT